MFNPVRYLFHTIASYLARVGLIDADRGSRIAHLTWPRFLTMFARDLYRTADLAMVGIAVGPAAIAGLAFASIFWGLANSFSLGIAGGTISQVSQRFGAGNHRQLDLAVKQSIWIGVVVTLPFIAAYWFFADSLVGLVGGDDRTIALGAAYLQILSVGLLFNVLNQTASRTLAGADDTWISMSVRATGAILNIVFNAVFIFALGMGVQGAALGTVLAEGVITTCLALGFLTGRLPVVGAFPVTLSLERPFFDRQLSKQLLTITPPLVAQHLARSIARFPLFAILAVFGPGVVAAYEVARRIQKLLSATGSGFSMAASGLVGQELGRDDEPEASRYASDLLRFSAAVYVSVALLAFVAARPLAAVFVDDPAIAAQTVPFIRVAVVCFIALGMGFTVGGILTAAGDNTWIFYGRLIGQYAVLIPLTYLGTVTPLGVTAVFLAMFGESIVTTMITGYRFVSGEWKVVSRAHRPTAADD